MVKRKKKPAKKTASRKPVAAKKKSSKNKPVITSNKKAHWDAYKALQNKVDKAWAQLQKNVRKKAPVSVLIQNKNELLLLLGECNYMARECMQFAPQAETSK